MGLGVNTLQWAALVVATLIALSSIDDLFVDAVFWAIVLKRKILRLRRPGPASAESIVEKIEAPLAIMLPAWKEFDVIESMIQNAASALAYRNYFIFVGTYANDAETIEAVERVAQRYKQVRHVKLPHDGPTCKADCLNFIIADIIAFEKSREIEFAGAVLHDSEDVLHPLELHLFNYLLPYKDMIQLPVVSLEQRYSDFVAGTYMDEFAEWHAKDLLVRQRLAKVVPSAGVGTCFSRRAIGALLEAGQPFNTDTLTEDYDIGNRLAERGMKSVIEFYPVEFRTRRGAFFGFGPDRMVTFSMPLCVREHFPNTFRTSYRQKARWILGITIQGWLQLGWNRSLTSNYFLFRDRKALFTPTLTMTAYLLVLAYLGVSLHAFLAGNPPVTLFSGHWLETALLWFNLAALGARMGQRIFFVERIYGWGHAVMSMPRVFVLSFINFAASMRAIRIFIVSRLRGNSIAWDKTMHRFPSDEWLGEDRRRIGEILLSWEAVTPPALEKALRAQKLKGGMIGDLLILDGAIDEEMLADALATQSQLPRAELNLEMVEENLHLFNEEIMARYSVLPFGVAKDGHVMLAVIRPLPSVEKDWLRSRLSRPFRQYIVRESVLRAIMSNLVEQPNWAAPIPPVPKVHEWLVDQKLLSKRKLRSALQDYDIASDGTIAQYLVAKGVITQHLLNDAMAARAELIEKHRKEIQKDLVRA
ncbi:glycosyl transferase family protein [Qipengyuania aestuarii]|uniref:glycosyl transferase family protein n=1 Tax=Qipengyuania aestuarii TaxID=2867241 RepID=UPI001FFC438F|nr:glycosyl transferase family protein [Qipengyuania aestuarii]